MGWFVISPLKNARPIFYSGTVGHTYTHRPARDGAGPLLKKHLVCNFEELRGKVWSEVEVPDVGRPPGPTPERIIENKDVFEKLALCFFLVGKLPTIIHRSNLNIHTKSLIGMRSGKR